MDMKNLIMMTFYMSDEDQSGYIAEAERLIPFWKKQGYHFSLFRDVTQEGRFVQTFQTDHSVDDFTKLIQEDSQAQVAFGDLKGKADRIVISVLDQCV